jgi:pyruvate formate lyase activating enzyme
VIEGVVFDIQHYAVHDGPGIRTLVFLKGCPLECLWCCNPESQRFEPELTHNRLRCRSCFSCVETCPHGAVQAGEAGPVFDRGVCRTCAAPLCVDACPQGALALAGTRMSAEQVMDRVILDKAFYQNSGGGVTFSGGEPFAQPDFLEELLTRSRDLGIHTTVETCGLVDPRVLTRCEPLVDLFLFDLKTVDPGRHERMTGAPNGIILENLRALAAKRRDGVTVRVPLVPGCTDGEDDLRALGALLTSLGLRRVELMPYHSLGADKYAALGRPYPLEGTMSPAPASIEACRSLLGTFGLACEVGGE